MSAKARTDLINKLHKFVKKEYESIPVPSNRSVLEHMIYACCLEDSKFEAADEALAKLQENFFDWNEVRVTTPVELAESLKGLANPIEAAVRVRKTLQGIFETHYKFDIDFLTRENLSKSVQAFSSMRGVTPFVVSYVAQNGLGGHSIPIDRSLMQLFYVIGIASESDVEKGRVPGLERTIPKAKGVEFSNLVHQFAVAFSGSPFSNTVREKILKIAPDAKERFPKRVTKKQLEAQAAAEAAAKAAEEKERADAIAAAEAAEAEAKSKKSTKSKSAKSTASKPVKKTTVKKAVTSGSKTAAPKKKTASRKSAPKKVAKKTAVKKASRRKK